MRLISLVLVALLASAGFAENVFRISVGSDYNKYSNSDLQRRVWELERAVFQLQQKVFELQAGQNAAAAGAWICKIEAMGDNYSGTGPSKAIAEQAAIADCKAGRGGDGFFCKNAKCEQ